MALLKTIYKTRTRILLLYTEAFFEQLAAGVVLKIIPFRKIISLYRNCNYEGMKKGKRGSSIASVQEIKEAVSLSSRISPWRNKCFTSSLAARRMLSRRGYLSELSLGMDKDSFGAASAHAWIKSNDTEIVEKGPGFTRLYSF
jgi:hypothetical protein